jgi:hypothetical protein
MMTCVVLRVRPWARVEGSDEGRGRRGRKRRRCVSVQDVDGSAALRGGLECKAVALEGEYVESCVSCPCRAAFGVRRRSVHPPAVAVTGSWYQLGYPGLSRLFSPSLWQSSPRQWWPGGPRAVSRGWAPGARGVEVVADAARPPPGGGGGWLQSLVVHQVASAELSEPVEPCGGRGPPFCNIHSIFSRVICPS